MANSLTNKGQAVMLKLALPDPDGIGTQSGFVMQVAHIRLMSTASSGDASVLKTGSGFVEVTPGVGGYNPIEITTAYRYGAWSVPTLFGGNYQIVLQPGAPPADPYWTCTGAPGINGIKGAYLTDDAGAPLCWWERATAVDLAPGDTLTLDDLTIRLT